MQIMGSGIAFRLAIAEELTTFLPASSNVGFELPIHSANVFPAQTERLYAIAGSLGWASTPASVEAELLSSIVLDSLGVEQTRLAILMDKFGSDKKRNGYGPLYATLLNRLLESVPYPGLLEIGLGTNNPKFLSTMGPRGVPGASVMAFREYSERLRVFGADLDRSILAVPRVPCAFVDQLRPDSFAQMVRDLGRPEIHLVIDDGLHLPEANLNTLMFGLQTIAPGGFVVIEDIPERSLPIWNLVERILDSFGIACRILRGGAMNVFVAARPNESPSTS